jgi:hypothetical protein
MSQALAVANKTTFKNCLVAMRPRATKSDIPTTHDVTVYIHNQFANWLKELKGDIIVSIRTYKGRKNTHRTPGCSWKNLNYC